MSLLTARLRDDSRFTIVRQLGAGGMGVVYEVYDKRRGEAVALKMLQSPDATAIYNFKKEFRTLTDVSHPNLVTLYELVAEDELCFFTMELVRGRAFIDDVRREGGFERLRAGLGQLATGVQAIHEASQLHCDLKPANVLVEEVGRLVILDFGLARNLTPAIDPRTLDRGIQGTLAYMSPEQSRDERVTRASDWYAVGVMLFEALTGRLPFEGNPFDAVVKKSAQGAPSPAEIAPALPEDLVALCNDLLARKSEDRPAGADVLKRLGVDPVATLTQPPRATEPDRLFGRAAELAVLERAFESTREGHGPPDRGGQHAVSVYVHGLSGMGKTSLIHAFLEQRIAAKHSVVLAGRCYERELVPYKALDGVVDSLSRFLRRTRPDELEEYLPRDVGALTRVFPVLGRVEVLGDTTLYGHEPPDPLTLRRRGFAALRELLKRLAERRPLVVYIDDLQWADADSIVLLEDLLRPPEPPPMLLVASFRREEIEARPFLRELLDRVDSTRRIALPLDPLPREEARALASWYLDSGTTIDKMLIDALVREAGGSPFLIEQLAGYVKVSESNLSNTVSLSEMLEHRIRRLPAGAERLLLALALSGHPLDASVAYQAAGLSGDERPLVAALRAARLVRSSGSSERIELYHDRIRETLALRVSGGEARGIHRRLAETLLARGFENPEALFDHFLGAGEGADAARYAREAARKASEALAFDHASWFYLRALELCAEDGAEQERLELTCARAEALSNAGRPAEAAEAFLQASRLTAAPPGVGQDSEELRLRHLAAHEYLGGGYLEAGRNVMREVLAAQGFKVPGSTPGKICSLLWNRARLRLRGLGYALREPQAVTAGDRLRIDTCYTVASYLSTVEPLLALDFQARHLRLALDAGDGLCLGRALSLEALTRGMRGAAARRQAARLCERTTELAERLDVPFVEGMAHLAAGVTAYMVGRWRRCAERCDAAEEVFTEQCSGAHWQQAFARKNALNALVYLGEIAQVRRRVPRYLAESEERGHRRAATDMKTRVTIVWLAADDPRKVHRDIEQALDRSEGFHVFHYTAFISRNEADLYSGDPDSAYRRLIETWPDMKRSMLPYSQVMRIEALFLKGRTELAAARGDHERLREAERTAQRIAREKVAYGGPLADLLMAGVDRSRGDVDVARRRLRQVEGDLRQADMMLLSVAARRQLGGLVGGDEGKEKVAVADAWMKEQEIERPERMARMLVPGFPSRPVLSA